MIGPHEISSTSSAADSQLHKRGIQTSPDGKTRLNRLELFDYCCRKADLIMPCSEILFLLKGKLNYLHSVDEEVKRYSRFSSSPKLPRKII
jgi:hypothetical protein